MLTCLTCEMEASRSYWQGPGGWGVIMQRKNIARGNEVPESVEQNIFSRTNSPRIPLSSAVSIIIPSLPFSGNSSMMSLKVWHVSPL